MKMVFKVKIHLKDGSRNVYNIVANDDVDARLKAETMEIESFKKSSVSYPGTAYCEIELACKLDTG